MDKADIETILRPFSERLRNTRTNNHLRRRTLGTRGRPQGSHYERNLAVFEAVIALRKAGCSGNESFQIIADLNIGFTLEGARRAFDSTANHHNNMFFQFFGHGPATGKDFRDFCIFYLE